jgi:hypothetical protein
MNTIHQAKDYDATKVTDRYVRTDLNGGFWFCEVVGADRRFDVRQGTVDRDELPDWVAKEAEARSGFYPSYVDWPLA